MDSLIKVFPQDAPRNGHTTVQLAIRSTETVKALRVRMTASPGIECQVRHVGYVPVNSNPSRTPVDELPRLAPAFFPDPLFEAFPYLLHANRTEAIWITVFAPAATPPGIYRGRVEFDNAGVAMGSQEFEVRVTGASVPDRQTLKVTNWFSAGADHFAQFYKLSGEDEHYWQLLSNLARVMADHKQNVILTPVKALATPRIEEGRIVWD
ncbi:MAG: hypothetical protein NTY38_03490, partial [Acidobacteria bacterium]|nr:hypothetical protein [Acidobacteriota bacterium]